MTSPNGFNPEGAYVSGGSGQSGLSDLNDLTEGVAKARMRGELVPTFNNQRDSIWSTLDNVAGAVATVLNSFFSRFFNGGANEIVRVEDGMTSLGNRLDLLTDVSGYGGMIMSNNHRFGGGSTYKVVPFNTKYGPSTPSVTVDTANNRLVLARGMWSVSTLLTVPQAGPTGGPTWFRATITAYKPDGTEYLNQWLDWRSGDNPHGYFAQVPLLVPDDTGYYVKVRFTHNRGNWRLLGGTDRTKFWVNRWDLRTDSNNIIIDPPDGSDIN